MRRYEMRALPFLPIIICALVAGCGGGGGDGPTVVGPTSALGWDPPGTYSDNAALDPYQDLEYYEVYVRPDQNFTDNDSPVALIKAVTEDPTASGAGKRLETEFILENLSPFVTQGKLYFVSLKAVGVDGQSSAFMTPISWDQRPTIPLKNGA